MQEIKDDIYRWKNIPCSWLRRINIVKMTILPKASYRFIAISINYQAYFLQKQEKFFIICMETQKALNNQSNLDKEEWSQRNQSTYLQTILQSYSHQDSMVLVQKQKYRPMEQDRKLTDKLAHMWENHIIDKGGKNIQWRKTVSSISGAGKTGQLCVKE